MNGVPKIGEEGEVRFVVEATHAIELENPGAPPVLSTPWLIWFLEHAAKVVMEPYLEDSEGSVGVRVDMQHLAATPLGQEVTCRARVISAEVQEVTFQIEAFDAQERVARGIHKRAAVRVERFAQRLARKGNQGD